MNLQIEAFVFQLYDNFMEKIMKILKILKVSKKLKNNFNLFLMHGHNYQGKLIISI